MQTLEIEVTGMTCQGCVARLTKVLSGTEGVMRTEVTLDPPVAVLAYDSARTDPEKLRERIVRAGYGAGAQVRP